MFDLYRKKGTDTETNYFKQNMLEVKHIFMGTLFKLCSGLSKCTVFTQDYSKARDANFHSQELCVHHSISQIKHTVYKERSGREIRWTYIKG